MYFSMPHYMNTEQVYYASSSNGSEGEVFLTFSRSIAILLFILNEVFSSAQYLKMGLIFRVA